MTEDRRPLKTRSHAWVQSLARNIANRGITPNQISLAGIGFAVVGFIAMWGAGRGWLSGWIFLLIAAACVQLRLLCNLLDGMVAVEGGKKQRGGELYNEMPDRVEDTLFLVGAGLAAGSPHLGWACAVLAVFTAYVRAFGASLGQGQDFGGPCAKPHRMFLLTVALLAAVAGAFLHLSVNVLYLGLWIIAIGTALSAALRIRRIYARLP